MTKELDDFNKATHSMGEGPAEIVTIETSKGRFRGYVSGIDIEARNAITSPHFYGWTVTVVGPVEEERP